VSILPRIAWVKHFVLIVLHDDTSGHPAVQSRAHALADVQTKLKEVEDKRDEYQRVCSRWMKHVGLEIRRDDAGAAHVFLRLVIPVVSRNQQG
jgi:hypothetical protein